MLKTKVIFIFLLPLFSWAQNPQLNNHGVRIMFYNVENLFHPNNDSLTLDDEFTPTGLKHWTYFRYQQKLNKIAQNIIAIGEWEPPAMIGLCEIENRQCLSDLLYNTPLKAYDYQIIHYESPDPRGIDVCLLYRPLYFTPITHQCHAITTNPSQPPSRDILYVKGLVNNDTIHCFVNHWPSRYGGQIKTVPYRIAAARTLKKQFDSLQYNDPRAKIIAMGDFNDYPTDPSIQKHLNAHANTSPYDPLALVNLSFQFEQHAGTNKYQKQWHVLDQFIINQQLLIDSIGLYTNHSKSFIFKPNWLLIDELDGFGQKPFRTYHGFKYLNGYSDHLPIYLDLLFSS